MPQATGLAAELQARFGDQLEVELVDGDKGIFDVQVGTELVYSKFKTGSFPRYREVPDLVAKLSEATG